MPASAMQPLVPFKSHILSWENGQKDLLISAWVEAFKSQGYGRNTDLLAEQKTVGTRDYTASIDTVTGLRSSADPEYGAIASARSNVTIVMGASVRKFCLTRSPKMSLLPRSSSCTTTRLELSVLPKKSSWRLVCSIRRSCSSSLTWEANSA